MLKTTLNSRTMPLFFRNLSASFKKKSRIGLIISGTYRYFYYPSLR